MAEHFKPLVKMRIMMFCPCLPNWMQVKQKVHAGRILISARIYGRPGNAWTQRPNPISCGKRRRTSTIQWNTATGIRANLTTTTARRRASWCGLISATGGMMRRVAWRHALSASCSVNNLPSYLSRCLWATSASTRTTTSNCNDYIKLKTN